MRSDYYEKFHPRDYVIEELCVVEDTGGPYLEVGWYIEDLDPETDWYPTDFGPVAKTRLEHEGKLYMSSDICRIPKN